MGRNTLTATEAVRTEEGKLSQFRRTLRREDQQLLDQLFVHMSKHTSAIGAAEHLLPFETMLLIVCLEQERELRVLSERLAKLETLVERLKEKTDG